MWTVCMTADWHGLTNCSAHSWVLQKEHLHSMMFILLVNKKPPELFLFKTLLKLFYDPFSYIWEVTLSNWETFSALTITDRSYSSEGAAWRLALVVYVRRAQSGRRRLGKLLSLQQGEVHVHSLDCPSWGKRLQVASLPGFCLTEPSPWNLGSGFFLSHMLGISKESSVVAGHTGGACGGPAVVGDGSCCHTSWKVPPRTHRQHRKALKRLETSTVCWAWRKTSTGFC